MHRISSHIVGLIAFALAGFLLAASTLTSNGADIRVEKPSELKDLVRKQAKKIDNLENQLIKVQRDIEKITTSEEKSQVDFVQNQLSKIIKMTLIMYSQCFMHLR